jgi:phage tail sheath gpL-like
MMHLPDHMTPERIHDIVRSPRGLVDAGVIAATAAGALAGTPILMAKQAVHNYKEHILKPNARTSQVSAGMSLRGPQVQNPWLSEGQATGQYGIRSTLDAQLGDGPIARNAMALSITAGVGGAAMFGAMSATSYGGGPGHPMNALRMKDPAVSAKAQMDADASNKIRMSDPSQLGLADAEEMYYSNPSMKPVQSRSRPGQYNDTGNLTLALSALRRG